MKTWMTKRGVLMNLKKIMAAMLLIAGLALTASAEDEHHKDRHGGGGCPAAPEPYVIAMLASGLGLVGGYVTYRVRKNKTK